METNEIMNNEEVIETTVEIADASSENGFNKAVGVGLAVLAGGLAYKFVAKPAWTRFKAWREKRKEDFEDEIIDDSDEKNEESIGNRSNWKTISGKGKRL